MPAASEQPDDRSGSNGGAGESGLFWQIFLFVRCAFLYVIRFLYRIAHVLWAVRVSTFSALGGALLLAVVPQAQDIFVDLYSATWQAVLFWLVFFIMAAFWAASVHYSARLILQDPHWLVSQNFAHIGEPERAKLEAELLRNYSWPVRWVPRVLGLLCFLGILCGLRAVAADLPNDFSAGNSDGFDRLVEEARSQIRYLTVVTAILLPLFLLFVLLRNDILRKLNGEDVSLWRALLDQIIPPDEVKYDPRLLNLSAAGYWENRGVRDFIRWFRDNILFGGPTARKVALQVLSLMAIGFLATVAFPGSLAWLGEKIGQLAADHGSYIALFIIGWLALAAFTVWLFRRRAPTLICYSLLVVLVVVALVPFMARGPFLAFLLGAWIPLLTFLAWLSHVKRAPVILLTFLGISLLTVKCDDNHDLRTPEANNGTAGSDRGLSLDDAVQSWATANGCGNGAGAIKYSDCPQPIIVAASGGASRAGFYTASVLGHLMDATPCREDASGRTEACPPGASVFAQRLFAISSVSGSSVGAAVLGAAMRDGSASTPPCASSTKHWFETDDSKLGSWKGCLQNLLAGDFLTPTAVGLVFRDSLSLFFLPDRAALLEGSWEDHYESLVGKGSMGEAFHSFAPPQGGTAPWRPLLLLNGTSVETGRRILTSHLAPYFAKPNAESEDPRTRLFPEAYDLDEIIATEAKKNAGNEPEQSEDRSEAEKRLYDVPLSTAAHNSARFPLISPPGNVRSFEDQIADRIVDGGYFENFGLTTAMQLREALTEFDLSPFVLLITNEPSEPIASAERAEEKACTTNGNGKPEVWSPPCPDATDNQWGTWLLGPAVGLYNTRNAHGAWALHRIGFKQVETAIEKPCSVLTDPELANLNESTLMGDEVHIRVCPDPVRRTSSESDDEAFKDVSMSWWLSKPVQAYLNTQLCRTGNIHAFLRTCEVMARPGKQCIPSDCPKVRTQ